MQVAIIGGTRHVGHAIVGQLVELGHKVSVYNRGKTNALLPTGVRRVVIDRREPGQLGQSLREHRPEAVIDMIGYALHEVQEVYSALPNLQHYVFCSTTAVYGHIGTSTPNESEAVSPDSPYTYGKVDCEQWLMDKCRASGFPATILRLAHPYGPRDQMLYTTGRESLFLDRMSRGRTIIIPGNGKTRIHPVFVQDAARSFSHVLGRSECMGQIYNLSGDQILTFDEYFSSIARVLGVALVAHKLPAELFKDKATLWANWRRKFDFGFNWVNYESAFDTSALQNTGFRCQTDHDTGVALTMQWLNENSLIELSSDDDEEDRILKDV